METARSNPPSRGGGSVGAKLGWATGVLQTGSPPIPKSAYLQGFGLDRTCGWTRTVFGPGFGAERTVRTTLLHLVGI